MEFCFKPFGVAWVVPERVRENHQMEKLIRETLIEHMEFGTIVFDVVYLEREKHAYV